MDSVTSENSEVLTATEQGLGKRCSFKKRSPVHSFLIIVQFSRFCLPPHFGDLYIIAFPVLSLIHIFDYLGIIAKFTHLCKYFTVELIIQ